MTDKRLHRAKKPVWSAYYFSVDEIGGMKRTDLIFDKDWSDEAEHFTFDGPDFFEKSDG